MAAFQMLMFFFFFCVVLALESEVMKRDEYMEATFSRDGDTVTEVRSASRGRCGQHLWCFKTGQKRISYSMLQPSMPGEINQ